MAATVQEWLRQADYDLDTAEHLLSGGRRTYAVFIAHLAVEEALKGIYHDRHQRMPPRTHNLSYLVEQVGLSPPAGMEDYLVSLTEMQMLTRYGDEQGKLLQQLTDELVREIVTKASVMIQWAKTTL